ncbi:hypothetical protein VIBNISOn1_p0156 [Vibrio nigripulchritudo SOn1]|uniref:Uncharacterized protein n=1 Tax=Vibrio nigripulchritudo SOn1 TaxID=1238450 RepID=A0AAV2W0C6_9VIBR|nr:hypothetical protein VIBNISOn1_p0156 [Vibrio nigripulchritudo SOn1]
MNLPGGQPVSNDLETDLEKLAKCLCIYNKMVAADMIYFWLLANRKVLDELGHVTEKEC